MNISWLTQRDCAGCARILARLIEEGHQVAPTLMKDAFFVIPHHGLGRDADQARTDGVIVTGGGLFADAIAASKAYTTQLLLQLGAPLPKPGLTYNVGGWFNGTDWVHHSFFATVDEHRFMNDEVGPDVGLSGSTRFFFRHARPKIIKASLLRLTTSLQKVAYRGPMVARIQGGGVKSLTTDLCTTPFEMVKGNLGQILHGVGAGNSRLWNVKFHFTTSVLVSEPPFPSGGNSAFITGVASTVTESKNRAYALIPDRENLQYRTDIGVRAVHDVVRILKEVSDGNEGGNDVHPGEQHAPVRVDGTADGGRGAGSLLPVGVGEVGPLQGELHGIGTGEGPGDE